MKEYVVEKYPEVFKDELSKEPIIEMRIALCDNAVPYCIKTPCQVPLRYYEAVYKVFDDLIQSKVIAKETRLPEWCSPAFFVPKPDGVRVRLVTNYTKLNRYLKRPIHPLPLVHDIVQSIAAGLCFFPKMDAIHRYFQLALESKSSMLTTFLLPSGRFQVPSGSNDFILFNLQVMSAVRQCHRENAVCKEHSG